MTEQIPWQEILNKLKNPRQPESEALRAWLNEGSGNQSALDDLQVIYSITGNMPEPFVPQKELAWQKIEGRITTGKIKTGLVQTLLRVAASLLLIAAGVGGGLLLSGRQQAHSLTEVYSPYGHKTRVELPDGSQVWLNGNSKIVYDADFAGKREVRLSGEALFKVTKDPARQFSVNSQNLRVDVFGTTFNVKSYPEDMISEVALVEGKVSLYHDARLLKKMAPGEVIAYNAKENNFSSRQGNIDQIISWKADELVIENETFSNVSKYLERWYGVKITLDGSISQNLRLSFKVKTESLIELLSIINHITPISYNINGKQVTIYKKQPEKIKHS